MDCARMLDMRERIADWIVAVTMGEGMAVVGSSPSVGIGNGFFGLVGGKTIRAVAM